MGLDCFGNGWVLCLGFVWVGVRLLVCVLATCVFVLVICGWGFVIFFVVCVLGVFWVLDCLAIYFLFVLVGCFRLRLVRGLFVCFVLWDFVRFVSVVGLFAFQGPLFGAWVSVGFCVFSGVWLGVGVWGVVVVGYWRGVCVGGDLFAVLVVMCVLDSVVSLF